MVLLVSKDIAHHTRFTSNIHTLQQCAFDSLISMLMLLDIGLDVNFYDDDNLQLRAELLQVDSDCHCGGDQHDCQHFVSTFSANTSITLAPITVTSSVTLPASTVTLAPDTVTLPQDTVTLPPDTITLPADTITLPADTVTLPPDTVTLPPDTVTLPPDTITQFVTTPTTESSTVTTTVINTTSYEVDVSTTITVTVTSTSSYEVDIPVTTVETSSYEVDIPTTTTLTSTITTTTTSTPAASPLYRISATFGTGKKPPTYYLQDAVAGYNSNPHFLQMGSDIYSGTFFTFSPDNRLVLPAYNLYSEQSTTEGYNIIYFQTQDVAEGYAATYFQLNGDMTITVTDPTKGANGAMYLQASSGANTYLAVYETDMGYPNITLKAIPA